MNEKVTAVSLCSRIQYCQSCQFSHFVAKTKDFVAKTKDFWWRQRIFYFFFIFAKNPSSLLHCLQCLHYILMREAPTLSMCRHTNEGSTYTEHVQMLHWACADIIMRGNRLTDMTDNTEDANTNWQCLHTPHESTEIRINELIMPKYFLIKAGPSPDFLVTTPCVMQSSQLAGEICCQKIVFDPRIGVGRGWREEFSDSGRTLQSGPPLGPRFWGPKIEHFGALINFSIIFLASLSLAYYFFICCLFIVQIQKFSNLASLLYRISHLEVSF